MTLSEGVEIQKPDYLNEGLGQSEQKGLNQAFDQLQSPLQRNQNADSADSADSAEFGASRSLAHSSGDESFSLLEQQDAQLTHSSGDESFRPTEHRDAQLTHSPGDESFSLLEQQDAQLTHSSGDESFRPTEHRDAQLTHSPGDESFSLLEQQDAQLTHSSGDESFRPTEHRDAQLTHSPGDESFSLLEQQDAQLTHSSGDDSLRNSEVIKGEETGEGRCSDLSTIPESVAVHTEATDPTDGVKGHRMNWEEEENKENELQKGEREIECEREVKEDDVEEEDVKEEDVKDVVVVDVGEKVKEKAGEEEDEKADEEEDEKHWFVMRDLKRANAKLPAYKQFMESKIEVFTPMHTILKTVKGRQRKVQEPFIRDLLFVHDTRGKIDPIVEVTPTLQYRYERGKGYKVPMVVRDADMNRFIMAVSTSKSTTYFTPNELNPSMIGRSVRITGGTLEGYTGKLLKISGSRAKRILVQLEGILAAGVEVDTQYLEVL